MAESVHSVKYAAESADLPKMLILGGWGTTAAVYAKFAERHKAHYEILVPEYPGFGQSPEPPRSLSVAEFAEVIECFCQKQNFSPDIVFAHSMGGRLTAKLLGREIPRESPFAGVSKVIVTGGAGICHAPKKSLKQTVFKLGKKVMPKSVSESMKRRSGSDDYRNATPVMRECLVKMVNEDLSAYFPEIKQETLLIWGRSDTSAPLSDGELIEKLIPNAGLAVIENAGHFAFLEAEELFYSIVKAFLKYE
jgi:pimeloyl-ACP methyl ester carboxylesterase